MIIGNPKVREKMNSFVDNACIGLFYCAVPFAIGIGAIVGGISYIFKKM